MADNTSFDQLGDILGNQDMESIFEDTDVSGKNVDDGEILSLNNEANKPKISAANNKVASIKITPPKNLEPQPNPTPDPRPIPAKIQITPNPTTAPAPAPIETEDSTPSFIQRPTPEEEKKQQEVANLIHQTSQASQSLSNAVPDAPNPSNDEEWKAAVQNELSAFVDEQNSSPISKNSNNIDLDEDFGLVDHSHEEEHNPHRIDIAKGGNIFNDDFEDDFILPLQKSKKLISDLKDKVKKSSNENHKAEEPLEAMVKKMLKPMIRRWLDTHLPSMVKGILDKEMNNVLHEDDTF